VSDWLGVDGEAWRWRRRLSAWEEMLGEFILLLHNVSLHVNKYERWLLTLETSQAFSVRSVYKFLTAQPHVDSPVAIASLWHKDIPLKVGLFAWRLFRDRLPTKDNLLRRGVINHAFRVCETGWMVRRGGGGYSRGRRRCWGNLFYCFIMCLYRLTRMIDGYDIGNISNFLRS
jgi:hypothetical protein